MGGFQVETWLVQIWPVLPITSTALSVRDWILRWGRACGMRLLPLGLHQAEGSVDQCCARGPEFSWRSFKGASFRGSIPVPGIILVVINRSCSCCSHRFRVRSAFALARVQLLIGPALTCAFPGRCMHSLAVA